MGKPRENPIRPRENPLRFGGPVLFASDDSQDAINDAKTYIARFGFTHDDVKLVQQAGQTLVIAKGNVLEKMKTPR